MSDAERKHVGSQLSAPELTLYWLKPVFSQAPSRSESLRRNLLIPKQLLYDDLHVEIL